MTEILNLLGGNDLIDGITKQTGISKDQVSSVVTNALPALMGAMQKNSQNEQSGAGLLSALQSEKHDGSLLNGLENLFRGDNVNSLTTDGTGILGHLFGGNQKNVENVISSKTGVSEAGVSQILQMLSPVLMSFLGKQVSDNNVNSISGLGSILQGFSGGNMSDILSSLDSNKDGSIIDDLSKKFLDGNSFLGGLFGGKK